MSFLFSDEYWRVRKASGVSQGQHLAAYLGGSAIQTCLDSPITNFRAQIIMLSKDANGNMVEPKIASSQAKEVFRKYPITASFASLTPRLGGVIFKRVPKFGILMGYSYLMGEDGEISMGAATTASILSSWPIQFFRQVQKIQLLEVRTTGKQIPVSKILQDASTVNFKPLFRGTTALMGHSFVSASLGLSIQPKLAKYVEEQVTSNTTFGKGAAILLSSMAITPLYILLTGPLTRIEYIMGARHVHADKITLTEAIKEIVRDSKQFGIRGVFRGNLIGIFKGIFSLSTFHFGREFCTGALKDRNERLGLIPN